MLELPDSEKSYWLDAARSTLYPELTEDIEVDVVIAGGGIAGLTCAYLLKQSGLKVAVLEKNTIGSGTTGGTTGKVSSQHGLIYDELIANHGKETAKLYADVYQSAIERMDQIIKKEKISCEWERDDNFVYTVSPDKIRQFKAEAKAAAGFGLPASFETKLPLPFKVAAAVKFANQAKFNAYKYVQGLAAIVHGGGSYVFEHSNAIWFHDGKPAKVKTKEGTVTAKDIIVATKVPAGPMMARGTYCVIEYPHTSYLVAGPFEGALKGMYISPDKNHYSLLPVNAGRKKLLFIGGENHIPGLGNATERYHKLADYAEKYFGVSDIEYRWRAMDYMAYDSLPVIGKVYPWSRHLYAATAFKKWGLSTSMVAASILHDLILGRQNKYAGIFTPHRIKPILSIPKVIASSLF
jgi:glycine/D-amino acid oxidase-like deaminating enzyme